MMKDEIAFASRDEWGPDQTILEKHVWPWAENLTLKHDSYR